MKNTVVKAMINKVMDDGLTDISDIYDEVEKRLKVPRHSIRRCARELRLELQAQADKIDRKY